MTTQDQAVETMAVDETQSWLDPLGAAASWLCAIHCIVLPFILSFVPLVGLSFLLSETTERIFIGISILLASLTLLPAYFRQHRKLRALSLFSSGIALIFTSHLFLEESLVLKVIFLLSGAMLITGAHLVNRRLCRDCIACANN